MSVTQSSLPEPGQILHLSAVDWKSYVRMRRIFSDRTGVRMTYDRGELEIMTLGLDHEFPVDFLGFLIRLLAIEISVAIAGGGSVTMKYRKKKRGLEPDRCFWIANEAKMHNVKKSDLRIHPPPDLALDVDVTSSSIDRMSIYAKLGVPEVWRLSGSKLTFHALRRNGKYAVISHSSAFPKVTPADISRFLTMSAAKSQSAAVAEFRKWIKTWHRG